MTLSPETKQLVIVLFLSFQAQLHVSGSNVLSLWLLMLSDFQDVNTDRCLCVLTSIVGSLVTVGVSTENTALMSPFRSRSLRTPLLPQRQCGDAACGMLGLTGKNVIDFARLKD